MSFYRAVIGGFEAILAESVETGERELNRVLVLGEQQ